MRIVSKYSDYYDIGLAYGIDKNIYFERKLERIKNFSIPLRGRETNTENKDLFFEPGVIGFCGKIYPFVSLRVYKKFKNKRELIENDFFYKKEDLEEFLNKDEDKERILRWLYPERFFEYKEQDIKKLKGVFENFNTPIFSYSNIQFDDYLVPEPIRMDRGLIINPILSKFKFQKEKDPILTFQEISMYLGTKKHPEIETKDMDDKIVAQSKGFNCMSFKKQGKKEHKC